MNAHDVAAVPGLASRMTGGSTARLFEGDAVNQVYNARVGDHGALDELYGMMKSLLSGNFAHVAALGPEYVDIRSGDRNGHPSDDAWHSQAGISVAATPSGYVPMHRIDSGMREAMDRDVRALPH